MKPSPKEELRRVIDSVENTLGSSYYWYKCHEGDMNNSYQGALAVCTDRVMTWHTREVEKVLTEIEEAGRDRLNNGMDAGDRALLLHAAKRDAITSIRNRLQE